MEGDTIRRWSGVVARVIACVVVYRDAIHSEFLMFVSLVEAAMHGKRPLEHNGL